MKNGNKLIKIITGLIDNTPYNRIFTLKPLKMFSCSVFMALLLKKKLFVCGSHRQT